MKITGPGNYSGPPAPPEKTKGGEARGVSPFQQETTGVEEAASAGRKGAAGKPSLFEAGLREIAKAGKAGGLSGEATVGKVVDSVLEQVLGNDFQSKPGIEKLREAMIPMLSQDEVFMGKLNNVLSRLEKS